MIPQACGAKYYIREEYLDETDVDDVVVALVNLARKVSCTYIYIYIFVYVVFCIFSLWREGDHFLLRRFSDNNLIYFSVAVICVKCTY